MITLIPTHVEPYPGHALTCVKTIGSFQEGEKYHVALQKCTGRIFKDLDDSTGSPNDRFMVFSMFGPAAYAIDKKSVLDRCFDESVSV